MGYTALSRMSDKNFKKYGIKFPAVPYDFRNESKISDLEKQCLDFIRDTCEGLRFDETKAAMDDFTGKSVAENQIPYNMEMDIDRLCFENALHRFMQSGAANDAFDVYFCYLEMFEESCGISRKVTDLLEEFENNASALFMKYRDYYSHGVYVFALGLAVYQNNQQVRDTYSRFYQLQDFKEAAYHYLKSWGQASLFHNISGPVEFTHPLNLEEHPLAYMLKLCDELQCCDRTSYAQNSAQELYAVRCDFQVSDTGIKAVYYYDKAMECKKDSAKGSYAKMTDEKHTFVTDIEKIVRINKPDSLQLEVLAEFAVNDHISHDYMSGSSFIHLYHFAAALNGRYSHGNDHEVTPTQLEEEFEQLSLEYKVSNILQAKAFAKYLDAVNCFYTDKPAAYEILDSFSEKQMEIIGPLEHARWFNEKKSMGWSCDTSYMDKTVLEKCDWPDMDMKQREKRLRELTRSHAQMIEDYYDLSEEEQNKDIEPMNCMLRLMREYGGLRFYRI